MKTILAFVCFLFILIAPSRGQNEAIPAANARTMAMGSTGVAFEGAHSLWRNQAGLAQLDGVHFSAFGEQRFLLSEIRSVSAGVALPTASGTFGLGVTYFGFDAFNQQQIGLAYGRKLMDELSIGAQFLALNTRIPDYGQQIQFTFEVGVMANIWPELKIGAHIRNPMQIEITENETMPTIFSLGLGYLPSEKLLISAELEKDINFPVRTKVGLAYQLVPQFELRAGMATQPTQMSFGLGYKIGSGLQLNVASAYHSYLGMTPSFDITYKIGPRLKPARPKFGRGLTDALDFVRSLTRLYKMEILLVSATRFEIQPLLTYLHEHFIEFETDRFQKGNLQITIAISGVGLPLMAFAMGQLLHKKHDLAINAGVAGAFNRSLQLGDVVQVVSQQFADLGAEEADGSFASIHQMGLIGANQPPFQNGKLVNEAGSGFDFLPKVSSISVNKVHGYLPHIEAVQKQFPVDIESMEGAAFFYACLQKKQAFLEIRSISNYVEARNRENWELEKAIDQLNEVLVMMMESFGQMK